MDCGSSWMNLFIYTITLFIKNINHTLEPNSILDHEGNKLQRNHQE